MSSKSIVSSAITASAVVVALLIWGWFFWPQKMRYSKDGADVVSSAPLEGQWRCVAQETDGEVQRGWLVEASRITIAFDGDKISSPRLLGDGTFSLPGEPANAIDFHVKSDEGESFVVHAIYARDGDKLTICQGRFDPDETRPASFETRKGDGRATFVFERINDKKPRPETAAEKLGKILTEMVSKRELEPLERDEVANRCLKIAENHPDTQPAVVALLWVLANAPDGPQGKTALALLKRGGILKADIETLAMCFGMQRGTIGPGDIPEAIDQELAPILLERVRRTPDDSKAAELLSSISSCSKREDAAEVSPVFDEAARMIVERWADSPDLSHFFESLSNCRQRPWAIRYEPAVRTILAQNTNGYIRHRAAFTLAHLVSEAGEARQEEARELYLRVVKEYKAEAIEESWRGVAEELVNTAQREIDGLLFRGVGGKAPDLKGLDLDGKPIELSEYKGKVVLLSFWASWCGPCMRLIPHERKLADQFKDRPFVVVGVNGDKIEDLDRRILETHKISWRSFQNERPGQKTIAREWNLVGWPELYIIDHTGKIRKHWKGTPPHDELDHEVERWVTFAEGKPLPPPLKVDAKSSSPIKGQPAKFLEKTFGEAKYAVCVPENHDGKTPLPVILFLHGSGQVGNDNTEQLAIGFGPAIRKNGMPFPFIGVFPQSQEGDWKAKGAEAKRALAILESVEREYQTDPRRVYLTGVSMGAEGVWSIAAAHPTRFAAIVPVCGGGNPKLASIIKDIPCWAFHGDADTIVPVQATRRMVEAITTAGGRPQYQEYRGLDHNCWDRAYGEAELYRWLQQQVRK